MLAKLKGGPLNGNLMEVGDGIDLIEIMVRQERPAGDPAEAAITMKPVCYFKTQEIENDATVFSNQRPRGVSSIARVMRELYQEKELQEWTNRHL